jgi:hypothetical protein
MKVGLPPSGLARLTYAKKKGTTTITATGFLSLSYDFISGSLSQEQSGRRSAAANRKPRRKKSGTGSTQMIRQQQ